MTFFNKIKWILGILMVFVLIVTTNLIDRNNFIRVKDSVVSIYEDRLVAKNLILDISNSIHKKEMAVALTDSAFFENSNNGENKNIQNLISKFETTKLTKEESETFNDLKENLNQLNKTESDFVKSSYISKDDMFNQISKIKNNLEDLSKIQLLEGSKQMSISKKAIDSVELFTQIEIYLLIFLAIVIQIIVMYNPKKES
ncbi:MCP four helix bundle domain-containing protein [Mesoflavibacter zeaxanthinifaciens]|uniref:MCP four helix bundle domain-containing protein n=1 Tax=Mesoflavibacter zeaxanthinifaciens TaxID=393060 RepID=UPI00243811A2|nr:MCP four helix bundle domain-containing protein [Mesoflavibacter zeaxanthinifaciens]